MSTKYNSFSSNGGHSAKSPGACSGEYKEHEQTRLMNKAFIKAMKARGYKVADTTSDARNKSAVLIEQVKKANEAAEGGKHLALSWHYNASGGTGTEVYHYGESTREIAARVSSAIAKTLGIRDRGSKQNASLYFLSKTVAPAILIEVCFIDNPSDMEKLEAKRQLVAEAVADV
ncbi:MAG: N-acetylmuramoyl-L-alanine amidase, partial [Coriobacteriales bacterium]